MAHLNLFLYTLEVVTLYQRARSGEHVAAALSPCPDWWKTAEVHVRLKAWQGIGVCSRVYVRSMLDLDICYLMPGGSPTEVQIFYCGGSPGKDYLIDAETIALT